MADGMLHIGPNKARCMPDDNPIVGYALDSRHFAKAGPSGKVSPRRCARFTTRRFPPCLEPVARPDPLRMILRLRSTVLPSLLLATLSTLPGADYYVDAAKGDDTAPGTSPRHAWRSLEKANSQPLLPGDRLLFKAGERWTGQLKPRGTESAKRGGDTALRVIGCYGEGPAPRIDGEGKHRDTLWIENLSFIEVRDLEITNHGPARAPFRCGVRISAENIGPAKKIRLRNLHVHDVNGDLRKSHEGCGIFFETKGKPDTYFDDLIIENCRVERSDRNGICQRSHGTARSRGVVIRGNRLDDIGGDGIKLWGSDGGIIEHNIVRHARARCEDHAAGIWPFACDDTLIQFNEVSGTRGTKDGQGYDADYYCRRTLFQYNLSHRNEGGFMLFCAPAKAWSEDTVVRYNLSIEDGLNSARVFHFGGAATRTLVHNNTIVIGPHQDLPLLRFSEWNGGKPSDTRFINNLFLVLEGGRATYDFSPSRGHTFEENLFLGNHVGLPPGIKAIPSGTLLPGPFEPREDRGWLDGLRPRSKDHFPRGKRLPNPGRRDFFGHPLPAGPPAIGAAEPAP
ncbi:MAG: hypothetical protein EAZ65_08600 [Verrucomicrobia bacterium]|nr:MAG: hypothetical protein EAZ65_08600 [Verrucomicrobiota bacterium]